MKIRYKILVVLAMMIAITACKKEFLDVPPIGKLSTEDFYKTDEDATAAIMATYDILQWMYARDWNSAYLVKTFTSDESNTGGGDAGDQPPYQELDIFTYGPTNAPIEAVWQSNYFGIYRANMVIENVVADNDYRKQIVAEAQFLRAYFYFEIVSMFGTGPLILTELSPSEYAQPFATREQIYAQIELDLVNAALVLPESYAGDDIFRVTKGAAQALLGKAFLYQEKWGDAATQFEEVIGSGQYSLWSDYSTLFTKEAEFSQESVFEVSFVSTEGYDWGTFQWGGNRAMENNIHWQLCGPRGDYFVAGSTGLIGGWGFNYPRDEAYQPFVDAGDEIRRGATLISLDELRALGGDWTNENAWGWGGYIRMKYGTKDAETADPVKELNYGTNLRVIRYADVLLMAAEAYAMSGNDGKAAEYLNMVRSRANLGPAIGNTMEAIKTERQLELCFEAVRFLDLVRWGDAADVLGKFGYVEGKHNVYPIPQGEMRNNGNATQNPGY